MSVRRWLVLLGLVSTSLVVSLAPLVWYVAATGTVPDTGPLATHVLQVLELAVASGVVVRRAEWARPAGLLWYSLKAIYAAGTGIGMGISGGWGDRPLVLIGLGGFWATLAFFLWWNRDDFG